jgi:hypothetical protein
MPKRRQSSEDRAGADPVADAPGETTLIDEWQGLVAAGRAAFSSEIAFQTARAKLAAKLVGRIAGLAGLLLALVFFLLMALVVGALLALGPVLGPWGALGVVLLALVVMMAVCVLVILAAVKRLKRILSDKGDNTTEVTA